MIDGCWSCNSEPPRVKDMHVTVDQRHERMQSLLTHDWTQLHREVCNVPTLTWEQQFG